MKFDSHFIGTQAFAEEDRFYQGARFDEIRSALFATAYYQTWCLPNDPPLPTYETSFKRLIKGVLRGGTPWHFLNASRRTIDTRADMRWGINRRGFRRLLHPNGVCLIGKWTIDAYDDQPTYSGYFKPESQGLLIARYSTGLGVHREEFRTLSMVGKLFPTTDPQHSDLLPTANFITQEEFGGAKSRYVNYAELRNAPDTTPWRRRLVDVPILLITGLTLAITDARFTVRQLYSVAELEKPPNEPTAAPEFMRLVVNPQQPFIYGDDLDFRNEIMAQIYDSGDPRPQRTLTFDIETSDDGREKGILAKRQVIKNWRKIGRIVFDEAVVSYNGDFVLHFHHPAWRNDRNDPATLARRPREN